MTWLDDVGEGWDGRGGGPVLAVRLVGVVAFGYVVFRQGAFGGHAWVAALSGAALVLMFIVGLLRVLRPFDGWAVLAVAAMMACGIAVNVELRYLGTVFFVVGGVLLVGQPRVRAWLAAAVVGSAALIMLGLALLSGAGWSPVISMAAGAAAVGFFGGYRRQTRRRQAQDRALAARTHELEQRNAELISQTEATRREAARAAALQERSRIAHDIHDVLAHSLGGLVVQLEAAGAELSRGDYAGAANRLGASRQLAVEGLREARSAVNELRDEPSEDLEPVDVVELVTTVLRGPVGLSLGADLDTVGPVRTCPGPVARTLAAVAREALTNINKHAPAARVGTTLVFEPGSVRLEVVNGLAEEPVDRAVAELAATGGGAGLDGLRTRIEALGGRFTAGPEGRRWVVSAECPTGAAPDGPRPVDVGADGVTTTAATPSSTSPTREAPPR